MLREAGKEASPAPDRMIRRIDTQLSSDCHRTASETFCSISGYWRFPDDPWSLPRRPDGGAFSHPWPCGHCRTGVQPHCHIPVATNLPADKEKLTTTSAEIVTASEDGNTLIYSDSPLGGIGFIDITDAKAPKAAGALMMDGEPTSVAVAGPKVLVGVNTSESKDKPSGKLAVVDIASKAIDATCDIGGQPDSVAVAKDGSFVAIAIENERDEDVNDGALPQMPAGDLVIVSLKDGVADCGTRSSALRSRSRRRRPEDPEPNSSPSTALVKSPSRCRKTTILPSSTARRAR